MTTVSWFTRPATRIPAANSEQFRSKQGRKHTNGIEPRPVAYQRSPTNVGDTSMRPDREGCVLRGRFLEEATASVLTIRRDPTGQAG